MQNKHYVSIAKGAGIAAGGASLTYLLQALPHENFGQYTALVTAALSIVINASLKYLESQRTPDVTITSLPDDQIQP